VAIRLFIAGEVKGKRRVKALWRVEGEDETCALAFALRDWMIEHCCVGSARDFFRGKQLLYLLRAAPRLPEYLVKPHRSLTFARERR